MKKIISSIIIFACININLFSYEIYASTTEDGDALIKIAEAGTVDDVIGGAQDFIREGRETTINEGELKNTSDFIYNLLLAVAIIAAVIIGMIIGIQFMTSGVEEKAKIKEALVPYVAGCVVVFGAFGIWHLAVKILSTW